MFVLRLMTTEKNFKSTIKNFLKDFESSGMIIVRKISRKTSR